MNCPDDNDYARLLDRKVSTEERATLEAHIDACAECRSLVAALGRAYAPLRREDTGAAVRSESPELVPPPVPMRRQLVALELVMAVVHLVWSGLLAASWIEGFGVTRLETWVARSARGFQGSALGEVTPLYAGYLTLWAPVGILFTLAAAYGLAKKRSWALPVAKLHAWASMPSLLLVPLGALTLLRARGVTEEQTS